MRPMAPCFPVRSCPWSAFLYGRKSMECAPVHVVRWSPFANGLHQSKRDARAQFSVRPPSPVDNTAGAERTPVPREGAAETPSLCSS